MQAEARLSALPHTGGGVTTQNPQRHADGDGGQMHLPPTSEGERHDAHFNAPSSVPTNLLPELITCVRGERF